MLFDISHEEGNHTHGHYKSHHHADNQKRRFGHAEAEPEFHQLQKACAEHDGNRQEKSEFRGYHPADADEQRAHDGCAGAGGAGEYRGDKLKQADDQGIPVGQGRQAFDPWLPSLIPVFNYNKSHAEQNQHNGHRGGIIQIRLHQIIQEYAVNHGRDAGHQNLEPHDKNIRFNNTVFLTPL